MKSMTGHGRGEAAESGFKIAVEVSSVNRKQSEIAVSLPDPLEPLEAQILARGFRAARSEPCSRLPAR